MPVPCGASLRRPRMMLPDGRIVPLTDAARTAILGAVSEMAHDALRCLALAVKVRRPLRVHHMGGGFALPRIPLKYS